MNRINKLNPIGEKILSYKKEYDSATSDIVKDALLTSLDIMIQQGIMSDDIKSVIMNNTNEMELIDILEKNSLYKKSPRELYKEYEKIRIEFEKTLKSNGMNGYFETESSVEFNNVVIFKRYSIDKNFIMKYFGLREVDLIQMMKKRGFAEKFAVLRMNLVFDEILKEMRTEEHIAQSHSLVYYNPDITGFSIDCKYHVNIDILNDPSMRITVSRKICEIDRVIESKFNSKIGIEIGNNNQKQKDILKENETPQEQKKEDTQSKNATNQNVKNVPQEPQKNIQTEQIKPNNQQQKPQADKAQQDFQKNRPQKNRKPLNKPQKENQQNSQIPSQEQQNKDNVNSDEPNDINFSFDDIL